MLRYLRLPALLAMFLALPAAGNGDPPAAGTAADPALHALRGERLRAIMRQMNSLIYEREQTALELARMREQQLVALAEAVAGLAEDAENLPRAAHQVELGAGEQATFRALANQLYADAVALRGASRNADLDGVDSAYRRLSDTCAACHNLFRDP